MPDHDRQGLSLIGLLATIVIIVILAAITLPSLKGGMGGGGTAVQENQASTHVDRTNLVHIYQAMFAMEMDVGGHLPTPSIFTRTRDKSLDTTANLFSFLVAQASINPSMLISENENSVYVNMDPDYNMGSYNPSSGTYWDPNFKADLLSESNVSFAHMPLLGERFRTAWVKGGASNMPVLGNRGPENGVATDMSLYYGTAWGGNILYADGHVEFTYAYTIPTAHAVSDNIFAVESGDLGADGILAFTKSINEGGFELQFD